MKFSRVVCLCPSLIPAGPVCQSHPPYYMVLRDRTDSINSDVLVKYGTETHRCVYKVDKTDYELKDVTTNRFVKVADPYLFLAGGSGPDAAIFVVYDLKNRKKVYEQVFMEGDIHISGDTVTFTKQMGRATRAQCKDYDKIVKQSLTPTLEGEVSFKLDDLAHPEKLKSLTPAKTRCVANQ